MRAISHGGFAITSHTTSNTQLSSYLARSHASAPDMTFLDLSTSQRISNSGTTARLRRAIGRTASMHRRMTGMVERAKQHASQENRR